MLIKGVTAGHADDVKVCDAQGVTWQGSYEKKKN
jgi:hypothetical protein